MGFLGLVPADQVTAMYLVRERKLRLHARGTVPPITTGIKFTREPWLGGLKFLLEGWTGPLTGGTEQYNVELSFNIQLPNLATPSDDLIVVTANHPDGFKVPIRFDGFNPMPITSKEPPADPGKADEPRVGEEPTTPAPPVFLPNLGEDEQINALFKFPFLVKENAHVPGMGSVRVKFDNQFLVMESAGIEGSTIVWKFNSLKIGTTQVIVIVSGGVTSFTKITVYDVQIFPALKETET